MLRTELFFIVETSKIWIWARQTVYLSREIRSPIILVVWSDQTFAVCRTDGEKQMLGSLSCHAFSLSRQESGARSWSGAAANSRLSGAALQSFEGGAMTHNGLDGAAAHRHQGGAVAHSLCVYVSRDYRNLAPKREGWQGGRRFLSQAWRNKRRMHLHVKNYF